MSGRLPSFRQKRDLTLKGIDRPSTIRGGPKPSPNEQNKKKFTPNLNVQRKDTTTNSATTKDKAANASNNAKPDQKSGWKKPNEKPKFEKPKPNLIQVGGAIFSEGVGSVEKKSSGWGSSKSGSSDREPRTMERPKMNLNATYDKAAEEAKLKELLRDDFIDDLKTGHLVPVQLPMISTGKVFQDEKSELKIKSDPDEGDDEIVRSAKKKNRNVILDSDDDDEEELAAVKAYTKPVSDVKDETVKSDLTISDLMCDQRGELLFFQLPDHLPNQSEVKQETNNSKNILSELPEGYLGKLQIRKSGRAQMKINATVFDVEVGTQVGFLQELFVINATSTLSNSDFTKGSMTNLGRVRNRVITMPAWKELFGDAKAFEQSSSDEDPID